MNFRELKRTEKIGWILILISILTGLGVELLHSEEGTYISLLFAVFTLGWLINNCVGD
ncbi:hypothetical protein [Methanobrevibacter arboriphilus]|uniref:Uncharacterized protein n=1 Tax=Methanobrevibacter arboriphilus TaxID=39441 RepID=A0ACA8R3S9_METAZ|nr:hypothetical protein [Methanobrevibacter arboriphilus]BBL62390.1 hypothetical protein MarbSA_14300 [Methanobrevibacter arboriphilus]